MTRPYIRGSEAARFWPKVDKTDGCWLWTAARNEHGYGIFRLSTGKNARAHRWSYEALVGPIPEGAELDHLKERCGNRHCVNPAHLEPVTHLTNCERGVPGGRTWRSAITHCPQGHEYDESNTYVDRQGRRSCRKCRAAATARYVARRR